MGWGTNGHLLVHFLYYCDSASDCLDRRLVLVAVFRWRRLTSHRSTGNGRRGILRACRRICGGTAHCPGVTVTASTASKQQLSLHAASSVFKLSISAGGRQSMAPYTL